jgi:hypothetical protein
LLFPVATGLLFWLTAVDSPAVARRTLTAARIFGNRLEFGIFAGRGLDEPSLSRAGRGLNERRIKDARKVQ